jgi:hypothetical protein
MATVAGSLHQQAEVEDLLRAAVFSARDTVPGAEEAGISVVYRTGQFHTVAATAPRVYQVDDLQYRFNEGPSIDALRGRWPAASNQLAVDSRWPRYAPRASALGIASQVGLRLFDEIGSVAALNLSTWPTSSPCRRLTCWGTPRATTSSPTRSAPAR